MYRYCPYPDQSPDPCFQILIIQQPLNSPSPLEIFMQKTAIIAIAVVAVLLVGGGAGAVYYMTNSSNDGSNPNSDFDFKDCHFDLSGAKSLVIADSSITGNSTAKAVSKNAVSNGAALYPFADENTSSTNTDYSLYKTDEYGNYIKVLLYGNDVQSGENGETAEGAEPIQFNMVPITMEISDDGKFILMAYSRSDYIHTNPQTDETYVPVTYVVVSTETGKVYRLNEHYMSITLNSKSYSGYMYDYYGAYGAYKLVGSYDSKLLLRIYNSNLDAKYYSAYIENDELVLKEILSSKIISDLSQLYAVYNYGIIKTSTWQSESYLISPDGGLAQFNDTYKAYGNNLCTSISYYDESTKFFASSYNVIKGINKDTGELITENVNLTREQSYQMALNNHCRSEIYKKTVNDGTLVYVMEAKNTLFKFKLNPDCTVTNYGNAEGRITLPFSLDKANGSNSVGDDTIAPNSPLAKEGNYLDGYHESYQMFDGNQYYYPPWTPYTSYVLFQGHICQSNYMMSSSQGGYEITMGMSIGDIVVSNGVMYKLSNGLVTAYNIDTGAETSYPIAKVVKVQSMDIINDTVVVKAIVSNGSVMTGSLDLNTGNFDTNYSKVLSEVRLKALN